MYGPSKLPSCNTGGSLVLILLKLEIAHVGYTLRIIIIISYICIVLFGVPKALYIEGGISLTTSIHLDDATAAIVRQNAHHTPAYWWRGDRVMKPISVWGWLGGHDGQTPMGKFGLDAGVTPLLFFEWHPGIFNDHRESGPRFNISSEGRCFLQHSVPVTTLGH